MARLGTIKWMLAVVIFLFVGAAGYLWTLMVERQATLENVARYNVVWLVSQAVAEFARLEQRIGSFGLGDAGTAAEEVQLRYDIILNRLQLFESGDIVDFLDTDAAHHDTVREFQNVIAAARPLVNAIGVAGNVSKLLRLLAPLEPRLASLAASANRFGGDQVADDQYQLIRLYRQFSAMALGLVICGVMLIGLLFWHNRLLTQAHGKLDTLSSGMRIQNQRFDAALNKMSQGLCMVDAGQRLIVCNAQYRELFGLAPEVVTPGVPMRELFGRISAGEGGDFGISSVLARQQPLIKQGKAGTYVQELPGRGTIAVVHQPMADGGWLATYEDISERRIAEKQIAHMVHHDALTDLPNRFSLRKALDSAFERQRQDGLGFSIFCLDLDDFKRINDALGHTVGDALLKAVADRLSSCCADGEVIARLGGDEYAILQFNTPDAQSRALRAQSILDIVGAPYDLAGQKIVSGTSIGVATAPADGESSDILLKNADLALYRAKSGGRGTFCEFEPKMDADLQARRSLESDLRKALASGEFELWYQPIIALATGQVTGCEALLRWRHPERGLVSPVEFIPVAEEIGLIVTIGEWVLRQACMQAAGWPGAIKVAVNLSSLQLESRDVLHTVVSALAISGLPAARLELEITESVFLKDSAETLAILHDLRSLGVSIAMDDFGTGYSSLSYLRSFPFDKIKLDQSFVRDLEHRSDSSAIVRSIAMLGHSLGMRTTAEGIETAEQLALVKEAGFIEGQGYYFARPQPPNRLLLHGGIVVPRAA